MTEYQWAGDLLLSEKTDGRIIWYCYDSQANLIFVTIRGITYFYVRNVQGDIIALVDADGKVVVKYTSDSWGKVIAVTGELADTVGVQNPFRYKGYYYDNETGMYYLKSRYYDAEIKRFICADGYFSTGFTEDSNGGKDDQKHLESLFQKGHQRFVEVDIQLFVQLVAKAEEGVRGTVAQSQKNPGDDDDDADAVHLQQEMLHAGRRIQVDQSQIDAAGGKKAL